MAKKKHSERQLFQLKKELEKAQSKTYRGYDNRQTEAVDSQRMEEKKSPTISNDSLEKSEKHEAHVLPVKKIKQDLLRIMLFALFSILIMIFLKAGNIDIVAIKNFLKF